MLTAVAAEFLRESANSFQPLSAAGTWFCREEIVLDSATHIYSEYLAGVVESDGRHFEAHTQGEQKEMDVLGLLLRRMAMWRTTQNW